jgi:hypothetical protein
MSEQGRPTLRGDRGATSGFVIEADGEVVGVTDDEEMD